ncbi:TetR/AcrR family transcriptional regulator [Sporichthya brevicatena]|uniref:TetR/AcrR family transcriptional regulator n=1 Tax=Sporichthya brevicatena TaxID=171442 RepID=A0ABN1GQB9_9ACTN
MGEVTRLPRASERRRPTAADDKRRAILAAVEELLQERPLQDISVSDIAAKAGVGRSGFYFYFASKGAAVSALLGEVFDLIVSGADALLGELRSSRAPADVVRSVLEWTWRSWQSHQVLILAMLDARGLDAGVREQWDAWNDRFAVPVVAAILAGETKRAGRTEAEVHEIVLALIGANERAFERLSRSGANSAQIDRTLTALTTLWSAGLIPSRGRT